MSGSSGIIISIEFKGRPESVSYNLRNLKSLIHGVGKDSLTFHRKWISVLSFMNLWNL